MTAPPARSALDLSLPVLLAGPTASGKSALALEAARGSGAQIINADALQVYDCWRVLTARPDEGDLARAEHRLYGHVGWDQPYSVGAWLREVAALIAAEPGRPRIIIGGTGLYFRALTEGLSDIPAVPDAIRSAVAQDMERGGLAVAVAELEAHDPATAARIDLRNPARVARALEVLRATGRGLADWHADQPPPLLPPGRFHGYLLNPPAERLARRIARRFSLMLEAGALGEARAMLDRFDPALPSCRAIGAAELIAHLRGRITLEEATDRAIIATRQYAKRQRTWFRARMSDWTPIPAP